MRGHLEATGEASLLRPSLWAMLEAFSKWLAALVFFLLVLGLPGIVEGFRGDEPWFLVLLENFQIGASLLLPLVPAVRVAFTTYTFDASGLRVRSQVLATQDHRVAWGKVTAIRQRRTLVDRLVGTSRIEVIAYGVRGATLRLVGVRDDKEVRDIVARAMRRHCTVGGLQEND